MEKFFAFDTDNVSEILGIDPIGIIYVREPKPNNSSKDHFNGFYGKRHTDKSKKLMSERATGRKLNYERTEAQKKAIVKIGKNKKGRKKSEEEKARLSALHKGKPKSAEQRAKMSASHKGKYVSEETKARMRESAKKGWEKRRAANARRIQAEKS